MDLSWMDEAACAQIGDVDMFHPEKGGTSKPAKKVCNGYTRTFNVGLGKRARRVTEVIPACPVKDQCLAFGMWHDGQEGVIPSGIYGGFSAHERKALRREAFPTSPRCGVVTRRTPQGVALHCDECITPSARQQRRAKEAA